MLVYREWLEEYISINQDMTSFSKGMIMSGSNVEGVEVFGEDLDEIVIGRVDSVEKHPNADKLVVCMVDVGQDKPVQIVTGAPNVKEGILVPTILEGGVMPDGTVIKRGEFRGVMSEGMLCSAKELGYDDKLVPISHRDGIWILDGDYKPGDNFVEALGLKGEVIEFEITSDRPDCLSMIGIAREAKATFGGKVNHPPIKSLKEEGSAADYIEVEIKDPELCYRYVARIVKDIKIGQSPWWLQKRLMHSGMRPINNIVDITNYVMLELGQPIHAFDIRDIAQSKIIVDRASDGEEFVTLDGRERKLDKTMLTIRDGERAVATAGVMGGHNSEIKDDTEVIVVESASFNMDSVRLTSKKLGLRTEASSRFEKGVDPELAGLAADRVCYLIESIGAGTVIEGAVDVYPVKREMEEVSVRRERVNLILGTDMSSLEMENYLKPLEIETEIIGDTIIAKAPTFRPDLVKEIDFIEEIARMYGYDKLPTTLPKGNTRSVKTYKQNVRDLTREVLVAMGCSETQTYSFVSPTEGDHIKLLNPLGEENSVMRISLWENMMEVLKRNFSRNIEPVRAFELGNIFINKIKEDGLPTEKESLCIAAYGKGENFFTLKGIVEELFNKMGITDYSFKANENISKYHPRRAASIFIGDREIGSMGEIHPDHLDHYDIAYRAVSCELDFDYINEKSNLVKYYSPLPRYPASVRDISILTDEDVTVDRVLGLIKEKGVELLEKVELFDVYKGQQVPEGKKSMSFTMTYRAKDRTLTDGEVNEIFQDLVVSLREKIDAVLRDI